jgi:tetratricopeptide (TPR) repeat protein
MKTAIVAAVLAVLHHGSAQAESAEELFDEGQHAYDANDYARAIDRWESSYQLSKEPGLLFNIAQAYRRAGNCTQALSSYRQFVTADPTSDRRPLADELVRELAASCGSSQHAARPPMTTQPATRTVTTDAGRNLRVAGLVTGGGGAALVVTGLLFGQRARAIGADVSDACAPSCDWSEQRGKDARGRRYATIGYTLDGIGVAAIATGAILYVIGKRNSAAVTVVPYSHEGGVGISWSAAW